MKFNKVKSKLQNVKSKLKLADPEDLDKFLKDHKDEVHEINKRYFELFNLCGKETESGKVQLGLAATFIYLFLRYADFGKEEKLKLLENIEKQLLEE